MDEKLIEAFITGTHNILNDEIIPDDAASDSQNWLTTNGKIELMRGADLFGDDGGAGQVKELHIGFKADSTAVFFRHIDTKIQTYNSTTETWDDVITGLTSGVDVVFANYQSLAGAFVYIFSTDGVWKICTANPGDFADMYDATKNFKGFGIIDRGRTLLWGHPNDPTGLYGSHIDGQDSTTYTTVSGEAVSDVSSDTLAFKGGGAKRTCFGIELTVTGSGQVFTDNYNGVLTGDQGGTGTINYMTGAITTDDTGSGTVDYQWEDSTNNGVLDFSKSATRLAGEGFILRQDLNGDPIQTVIPLEGDYYSIKETSAYRYIPDSQDENPVNEVYRTDIGVPSRRAAIGTGSGIVFINTANPDKPVLTILERNPVGDNIIPRELTDHYDYSDYTYDTAAIETYNRYITLACAEDSTINNRILVVDLKSNTVDKSTYPAQCFAKTDGVLYAGDPASNSVYKIFNGFDNDGDAIVNYWNGKGHRFGSNVLKKFKRLRFRGEISRGQVLQVYLSYDNDDYELVGTIRGDGEYVDVESSGTVGSLMVGEEIIGGGEQQEIYPFFLQLRVKSPKFRKVNVRFVATEIGYVSINYTNLFDIWTYEERIPSKYRRKQNVSLDGQTTNLANPE